MELDVRFECRGYGCGIVASQFMISFTDLQAVVGVLGVR